MAMNLDALLRIKADVQGENNIRRLGSSLQSLQGQAKAVGVGFNALKGAVAGFGAAIAGSAIVGGLTAIVKKSIDAGDELFNLQAKTGIAANALIGLGNAAKLADVDQATLAKGLTKLSVNLVKAAEGNDGLARKFKALGVSIKDSSGQVVPADKALKQIADRFADMPDGAQKAAAAVALFGKSGAELIPLLNEGAAAMEKFTYKVGEDFAARSDLFNDTITELGIKTQGFGLELTDALLPALQSILEVFADLFNTDQDWTALFKVIEASIRGIAVVIYTLVKAVDVLIKNVVAAVQAAQSALSGDFAGAWNVITSRVSSGIEEQKKIFADLNKLAFGSAPSPGTGRRTGGRNMELDTSSADRESDAAARRRAAEAKRAAAERARDAQEQERLAERRTDLTQKAISLQKQLQNSLEDVRAATAGVGAGPVDSLLNERSNALTDNNRLMGELTLNVINLKREIEAAGGTMEVDLFAQLINGIGDANEALANKKLSQGLIDLLPSLDEYDAKIKEVQLGKTELTEVEKLNAQVNLLQLDILAATNPALAEQIRLLRERAGVLDDATKKQEKSSNSFGAKFKETFKQAYDSATDLGTNLANIAVNGIDGLTNSIVELATTGKAAFKEFAASILKELGAMLIKMALFKAIGSIFGFENGGVVGGVSGPSTQPRTGYAKGGTFTNSIVSSPTLFKFASGGAMQNGVMGEAGPEAIMPLKRGADGKLGVAVAGHFGANRAAMAGKQSRSGSNPFAENATAMAGSLTVNRERAIENVQMAQLSNPAPMTVSYQSEVINNVSYVSEDQFQKGLRDTANRARMQTLSDLKNKPATRSQVGMR